MTQIKIAFVFGLLALSVGCASGSSPQPAVATTASNPNPGPLVTNSQIQGEWLGVCGLSYAGINTYEQFSLTFSNVVIFNISGYSDSACAATPLISTVLTGSYQITGLDSTVRGASDLTFALTSAQVTPNSVTAAAALNTASTCGLTNWQSGVSQTISLNASCLSAYEFNMNQIIAIQNGNLYFGNSDDSAINTNEGYTFLVNNVSSGN